MVNFSPLAAEIGPVVWGTPANFNGFRLLAALLERRRSTEANQTLHCVWPYPISWYITYTFSGVLARYGILPDSKFTLLPTSLALSWFGSVAARHLSSGHKPNFAALSTGRDLCSVERPSRWHWPTF